MECSFKNYYTILNCSVMFTFEMINTQQKKTIYTLSYTLMF